VITEQLQVELEPITSSVLTGYIIFIQPTATNYSNRVQVTKLIPTAASKPNWGGSENAQK